MAYEYMTLVWREKQAQKHCYLPKVPQVVSDAVSIWI